MLILLLLLMLCLLLRAQVTMAAASAACRLFVTAVLPGLFPYMVLSQMLISRVKRLSPALVMGLGWGGGSPTGAKLAVMGDFPPQVQRRLMLTCATMSPMFLLGTVGRWLDSPLAGAVCLGSSLVSGWVTGWMASRRNPLSHPQADASSPQREAFGCLSFGAAVESAGRTMLLVCGTMVMLRVFAALAAEALPDVLVLPVTTVLEVTTGAAAIAQLPLPLPFRTALIAGATGFGGMAILMQNRAVSPGTMSLGRQIFWQAVHGGMAFLLALGIMHLIC
ncbi:MAG: hypothetical protein IJA83_00360 [Clostridia bacterium]|nr:hypothetical protein [Clostridia bacterium]